MADTQDMIVPMIRELRNEVKNGFASVDKRLASLEKSQTNFRQGLVADTMMGKLVTGDFEERIVALEKQVADLMRAS